MSTLWLETTNIISNISDNNLLSFGRCVGVRALSNNDVGLVGATGTLQCSCFFSDDSICGFVTDRKVKSIIRGIKGEGQFKEGCVLRKRGWFLSRLKNLAKLSALLWLCLRLFIHWSVLLFALKFNYIFAMSTNMKYISIIIHVIVWHFICDYLETQTLLEIWITRKCRVVYAEFMQNCHFINVALVKNISYSCLYDPSASWSKFCLRMAIGSSWRWGAAFVEAAITSKHATANCQSKKLRSLELWMPIS